MTLFPIFVKLQGRRCLVVGAGTVGEPKIAGLLESGAKVRVVASRATEAVVEWAQAGAITWEARAFAPADLDGQFLVVAATNSPETNELIFREAQLRGVLCNAVDEPERCDFYYPAIVRRGQLQIAISTNGQSPALAQRLRGDLEEQFGPEYGPWLEALGRVRQELMASAVSAAHRRDLLHDLASQRAFLKSHVPMRSAAQ